MAPSNPSRAGNPFDSRMSDNLNARSSVQYGGFPGNTTAARTILGSSSSNGTHRFTDQPSKRQKTEHPNPGHSSKYFPSGGTRNDIFSGTINGKSNGKGKGKGKGKERTSLADAESEVETISSEGEDIGVSVSRPRRTSRSESPDPIDFLNNPPPPNPRPQLKLHPFDAPSKHGPLRGQHRLPDDGTSTLRLQEQHKQRPGPGEVINIDSDDIESASGFDVEDAAEVNKTKTPNGRTEITRGNVKSKITQYECYNVAKPTPFIDFNNMTMTKHIPKSNRVAGMKGKNQKSPHSLGLFNQCGGTSSRGTPLDPIATAPSGFASNSVSRSIPAPLPMEAWSLGCDLFETDENGEGEPVSWLLIDQNPKRTLKVLDKPSDKTGKYELLLDRAIDSLTCTDPLGLNPSHPTVIQLRTTKSAKKMGPNFEPGSKSATGFVTFKLLTRHANWMNGSKYKEFVDMIRAELKDSSSKEILRGSASQIVWDKTKAAAQLKSAEVSRHSSRLNHPTSSRRSPSPGPLSAGASNDDSTAVQSSLSDQTSGTAPPAQTYGRERRVTRHSVRSTRTSPTPDLDELVLVYPASGPGAVNINRGDLKRLDDGQYLNDTIIEFGLKLWLDDLRKIQPELADQVHVFNSFFYKKLASKKEVADTYASVRKWTSKVDIFKKKYIIVPINENFHWYLAIIEDPQNILHPPPPKPQVGPQTRKRKREFDTAEASTTEDKSPEEPPTQPAEKPPEPVPEVISVDAESEGEGHEVERLLRFNKSCSINDEDYGAGGSEKPGSPIDAKSDVINVEEPMDVDSTSEASKERTTGTDTDAKMDDLVKGSEPESRGDEGRPASDKGPSCDNEEDEPEIPLTAEELSQFPVCYIYTFDSLRGRHPGAYKRLAAYLQHEAVDKKKFQMGDTTAATQKYAKTPMQKNYCDCGLFVLAFVDVFMRDPVVSSQKIRNSQWDWYANDDKKIREVFRTRMVGMSEEWKKERAAKEGEKDEAVGNTGGEGDKGKAAEGVDDEDDDVIISDVVLPPPKPKSGSRGGKKEPAARLRG